MLDKNTKQRIDNARAILVGKIPDPKAQVEQITIALIYKFMDDIDQQSQKMSGKPSFFTGELQPYAWPNLLSNQLSAQAQLELYVKAITKIPTSSHLPELFRQIFKGSFLPFRDARTIRLFLKEINQFSYDNSENLGDAFEYLLSILGSQGDAGQFRTPRHIIDFIVKTVAPQKHETILDPACGTAGFLISAYKHILTKHSDKTGNSSLNPDQKTNLLKNIVGYDISPDMVKLALVNLYLHGSQQPWIHEYDTLTSEEKWNDDFDVILANPPFMTPKGGIVPHNRFNVQANRSEVLFVDYIAEHLTTNGRAGFVVPEGIIFRADNAYKQLRKNLVENWGLYAVVSLPSGVFQPYSGVKTSVLLLDKLLANRTKEILFVKVANDGYDLGQQRQPIDTNDLPNALTTLIQWQQNQPVTDSILAHSISKQKIAEDGDYNLTGDRYRETIDYSNVKWPMVELGKVANFKQGKQVSKDLHFTKPQNGYSRFIRIIDYTQENKDIRYVPTPTGDVFCDENELIMVRYGQPGLVGRGIKGVFANNLFKIDFQNNRDISLNFIFYVLNSEKIQDFIKSNLQVSGLPAINHSITKKIKIPLPPLEIQEQIVAEIEAYQKVIDGAKQVVENWKPTVKPDPNWQTVALGDVCVFNPPKYELKNSPENTQVSFVPMADLSSHQMTLQPKQEKKLQEVYSGYTYFAENDVLLARVTPCFENGKSGIAYGLTNGIGFGSSEYFIYRADKNKILPQWIYYFISSDIFIKHGKNNMTGTGGLQRLTKEFASNFQIPLPPLEIQEQIVAKIEAEQTAVNGCKKLISTYEQKITNKINEVWQDK